MENYILPQAQYPERPRFNLAGSRYGKLYIVRPVKSERYKRQRYECLCDCGKTVEIRGTNIISGRKTSCGCSNV